MPSLTWRGNSTAFFGPQEGCQTHAEKSLDADLCLWMSTTKLPSDTAVRLLIFRFGSFGAALALCDGDRLNRSPIVVRSACARAGENMAVDSQSRRIQVLRFAKSVAIHRSHGIGV